MKNNKKLARNAIRARKAQKKRANEQDKPKKGKRWYSRLFALIGCLLLVSALALPCFADPVIIFDAPLKAYEYFRTQYLFNDANHFATQTVMNYWFNNNTSSYGNIGIFRAEEFVAGTLNRYSQSRFYLPQGFELSNTQSSDFTFDVDRAFSALIVDSAGVTLRTVNFYGDSLDATLVLFVPDYDDITLYVEFTDNSSQSLRVYYTCLIDDGEFICTPEEVQGLTNEIVDWQYFFSSGVKVQTAFTPVIYDPYVEGSSPFISFISDVIGLTLYHPYDYWVGWSNSNSYYGGNQVYQDGYDLGYDEGYIVGFNEGVIYVDADAFQAGYDKALGEIKSGDFGRNFLGGIFSAPVDALNNFTLIDYELMDGRQVTITLGSIIGAALAVVFVIWFLKLFAGG